MTVPSPTKSTPPKASPVPAASALYLREDELRRGIELLYFGYTSLIRGPDELLADEGLGRAHHRALYFIARKPGLAVGELLRLLAITKQSLGRVLNDLQARDLVVQKIGTTDRRQRLLHLTPKGESLETALFERLQTHMAAAYSEAGQNAVTGFWNVLMSLIPPTDRPLINALQK